MKPSGGRNMKIKEQLPPLIRGNSRQAGVTKAEQEKPLTANHCIDPQASPLTTSRSTAPPLHPCPHTCMYTAVHRPLRAPTCTRAQTRSTIFISMGPVVHHPVTFPSADSAMWSVRFCPFALSEWHQRPPPNPPTSPHPPIGGQPSQN